MNQKIPDYICLCGHTKHIGNQCLYTYVGDNDNAEKQCLCPCPAIPEHIECLICKGDGSVSYAMVDGDGYIDCENCDGTGSIKNTFEICGNIFNKVTCINEKNHEGNHAGGGVKWPINKKEKNMNNQEILESVAAVIEQGYVSTGHFADDKYRKVTEDDMKVAKKVISLVNNISILNFEANKKLEEYEEAIQEVAKEIEETYVELGIFDGDEYHDVTDDDRLVACAAIATIEAYKNT